MILEDRRYFKEHTWAKADGQVVIVGITDFAQNSLGDIVYVDLPEVGACLRKGEVFGKVESVKAISDLYAPRSGRVLEVNSRLELEPEIINADPYNRGWMLKLEPENEGEWQELLTAGNYRDLIGT